MRKLAAFAFSFSAAVFFCNYSLPQGVWPFAGVGMIAAFWAARLILAGRRRLLICLICSGLSAGFLWMTIYDALFFQPARELDDQTVRLTATVLDYPSQREYGWQVPVRMKSEHGASMKVILYTDEQGENLLPGDEIESVTHLTLGTYSASGEEISYYTAKGIFLWGQCYGTLTVRRPEHIPMRYWSAHLAGLLKGSIDAVFPDTASSIVRAVVTGSRDKLTDQFTSSLERTGLSHTVAVSGMHLSCFAGILALILGRGKRSTALIVIFWALLFSGIAGSTPSVSRAAVMIILLQIAPLLRRERDDATALAFALMLLMLWNPYSAAHVGLQLSFASVAGILFFANPLQDKICKALSLELDYDQPRLVFLFKCAGRSIVAVCSATMGAMAATIPLTALYFGKISLIAPLTNLLTLWAVTAVFAAGLVVGVVGIFLPELAGWLTGPVSLLAEYLSHTVDFFSGFTFAALSLDSVFYRGWLILAYVLLISAAVAGGKRRYIIPGCCLTVGLCVSILCTALSYRTGAMTVTALDVGQGQSVLLRCEDRLVLVDCGGDNYDNPGDIAADYIQSHGYGKLDFLILTHYHSDHANGVLQLMRRIKVDVLLLPDVDEQDSLRKEILSLAQESRTQVRFIETDMSVFVSDDAELIIYPPMYVADDANEQGLSVLASVGENDVLITGDMGGLTERLLVQHANLPDTELLIIGHHGSKDSTTQMLLDSAAPELGFISVGEQNHYGHPAQQTLQRLSDAGIEVYRTDQSGNLCVTFYNP